MAVVATRRRDNDGRFAPTSNCHPNPPWFLGEQRLRCRPERAFSEVAASKLLRKRSIARFARSFLYLQKTWIVKTKLKIVVAEARLSALAPAWTTVRRNHASVAALKSARTANAFFRNRELLGSGDDDVPIFDANPWRLVTIAESDAQHQFRRIEPRDFQAHAGRIFEQRHREIAEWLFQIPCSRVQIPCSFAEIPCSAKWGICRKPLNSFKCRRSRPRRAQEFDEIPVNFPLAGNSRWRRVRTGLRPPPRSPPNLWSQRLCEKSPR